jgi:hypothetical protein
MANTLEVIANFALQSGASFKRVCIHLCLWLVAPIAREKDSFPYRRCDMEENIVTIHTEAGTAPVSISYGFQSFRKM